MIKAQQTNGLRYRRGGFARPLDIMAQNFANRAGFRGALAPSATRRVSPPHHLV